MLEDIPSNGYRWNADICTYKAGADDTDKIGAARVAPQARERPRRAQAADVAYVLARVIQLEKRWFTAARIERSHVRERGALVELCLGRGAGLDHLRVAERLVEGRGDGTYDRRRRSIGEKRGIALAVPQ